MYVEAFILSIRYLSKNRDNTDGASKKCTEQRACITVGKAHPTNLELRANAESTSFCYVAMGWKSWVPSE